MTKQMKTMMTVWSISVTPWLPAIQHPALVRLNAAAEELRLGAQQDGISEETLLTLVRVYNRLEQGWRIALAGPTSTEFVAGMESTFKSPVSFDGRTAFCRPVVDMSDREKVNQYLIQLACLALRNTVELTVLADDNDMALQFDWDSTTGGDVPSIEQIVAGLEAQ